MQRRSRLPRFLAAFLLAFTLTAGACSNSDADKGDTQPRNNTEDPPQGDSPGAEPGGSDPEGEGTGSGRGD